MQKGQYGRKDRLIKTKRIDTYRPREKWPEPTRCTECNAVYTKGRWTWEPPPPGANETVCPACRRIADHYPAGYIELRGAFFETHREELLNLVRNVEQAEKALHPLERLIEIRQEDSQTVVTTTGVHVARRIGEALARSYEGEWTYQYGDGAKTIRARWER
ncbi:ATPase [Rhodocaloribacter litoris]|uniref:BCAM0308 family protein n=1 Tax=Rhodocaloribacter litoris TaxID=2558931 RepID=UPI0014200410|nr:BCAM0308 family protein [Rhodocaloribacter litoris]QXD16355.1 ATPase [Rhodocaloribacter litoris]